MSVQPHSRGLQSTQRIIEAGLQSGRKGRLDRALRAFTRAIKLDRQRWEAYRFRAIAKARMGRYDSAITDMDAAIHGEPRCVECYHERATMKLLNGLLEGALTDLARCMKLDGSFAPAYSTRAGIYMRMGQYREALGDINMALSIEPDNSAYLHNRAVIMTALERYKEAIEDYLRVIELDPLSGGSYNNLAWLLATAKDPEYRDCRMAITYAQKALEMGNNGSWMDTLAAAYAECGQLEKAVEIETEAYRLSNPPNENFRRRIEIYRSNTTYAQWRAHRPDSGRLQ